MLKPAVPAAGAEWTITLPGGYYYRLLGGVATFTASAVVATRLVGIAVTSSDGVVFVAVNSSGIPASNIARTAFASGIAGSSVSGAKGAWSINAPPFWMHANWTLASSTTAMDAGDTYTAITLLFERLALGEYGHDPRARMDYEQNQR